MNLLKKITISMLCCILLSGCYDMVPIENLSIITGFGYDIEKNDKTKFISSLEFMTFPKKDEIGADSFYGEGDSIYASIENYKSKQGKPFTYGSELVYIISEDRAKFGIEDIVSDLLLSPDVNVNARILICKGRSLDYFSIDNKAGSASEQLANITKFQNQEYYSSNEYTVNNFLCMYYQQGRNLYLPYIEIIDGNPQLTGVAIFDKDNLFKVIPTKEVNLINLLRDTGGYGIISILSEDPLKYLEMDGKSKTKVKVSKENQRLKYDITINLTGNLRLDTLCREEYNKDEILKLEKLFEDELEQDLNKQIKKVQDEYGIDCFDITKHALAKFGKNSEYQNKEYFTNSDINVDVNVKIKSTGRVIQNAN